jgi:hypothetical protein
MYQADFPTKSPGKRFGPQTQVEFENGELLFQITFERPILAASIRITTAPDDVWVWDGKLPCRSGAANSSQEILCTISCVFKALQIGRPSRKNNYYGANIACRGRLHSAVGR